MKKIKVPKRMTLKQARDFCQSQWRYVIKRVRAGDRRNVSELKHQWILDHGLERGEVDCDCFYCEYADQKSPGVRDCKYCPGRKIDPEFDCRNVEYRYIYEPEKFYKKLLELKRIEVKNAKRKADK
ncbi:MAG: hypothetical protein FVQ80_11205 [Planctomycetes bacterium]|nr:hypothetical protein [Planctomycetota bacterium]